MPLTPLNNDFLQCPICFNPFSLDRKPITLACSHTCCCSCLTSLQNCPFDQTLINAQLPENEAILSLIAHPHLQSPKSEEASLLANGQPLSAGLCHKLLNTFELTDDELVHYCKSVDCIKQLAQLLRPQNSGCALSRSMQRKLVTFLHCQLVEPEGRLRAVKNARSIGERTLSELLLKHQDPYTLSANLWAAVRSRGCQFLGPAMQEEILKLVLLALEEGSQLSRKVLVMFVVQRLSPHFPHQASKTAIGHVIQLLYRASCFRLTKRDGDSSLMQLKEEYCSYEALRREHDTQIVSIALESGLKILPDQWSSLLYGDMQHKSHMQSIIDKLQSPQSFHQSIQELVIALQRTQDPAGLIQLREHFERLARIESAQVNSNSNTETSFTSPANIETVLNGTSNEVNEVNNCTTSTANDMTEVDGNLSPSVSTTPTTPNYPTFQELAEILDSCRLVTFRLIDFLRQHGGQTPATNGNNTNGINGAGPHRYNGRGSSGGLSTGSGGRYRGGPRGNAPKQSSFASAPPQVNGVSAKAYGGPISPEKTALQLTNGYKSNSQPALPLSLTTNSNVGLVGGSRVVRDQKHKSCAQVQPCTQSPPPPPPPTHVINVKPAHVVKSTSPKHQQQLLNGYKGGHGNNYTNGTINQTNGQARRAEINNYPFKMNQINAALNEHANALNTKNRSTLPLQTTQYLKQQQQLLKQLSPLGQPQTLSQTSAHLTNGCSTPVGVPQVKNMQNGLSINQATTKNFLSLLSGNATVSQKSCSSAAQTATIGSFEDDQFIPFADQPFVSKFGPISRSMQLLDTQTITGSTARSTSASGLGHSNEQLRDIWSSGFGTLGNSMSSEDATTHLTNVMLGRQGMPSLTLIEPLQQLSLNSSIFADQQFL